MRIGEVARVLDNAREHIFDGIVVKTDSRSVFVDAPEVARISLRQVTLTISASQASSLPEPQGTVGGLETRLKRTARRWQRRFGR